MDIQKTPASQGSQAEDTGRTGHVSLAYVRFVGMVLASAVLMYVVMYLNTEQIDHVYFSWTRLFMTMMAASVMALVMLAFMRNMYTSTVLNTVVVTTSVLVFGAGLWLVRSQATIGDRAWMEGMIPHHSIAILTSENAHLSDPRVRDLAQRIIDAQRAEIAEMKQYLHDIGE